MEGKDVKGLMEAYSKVNEVPEVIDEEIVDEALTDAEKRQQAYTKSMNQSYDKRGGLLGQINRSVRRFDFDHGAPGSAERKNVDRWNAEDKAEVQRAKQASAASVGKYYSSTTGKEYSSYKDALKDPKVAAAAKTASDKNKKPEPGKTEPTGSKLPPAKTSGSTAPSKAAQPVLSMKGGVTGTGVGKDFKAKEWSAAEKARYNKVSGQKKDAATNAKYQELRKSDPAKAKEFGMKANQEKFGKDFAKPKTPNPLMKDMPGQNKAELERVRGNAAIDSISKSPSAKKILTTSKIGQASLNRSEFGSATKPAPAPKPAAATPAPKPSFGTNSTSTMNKTANNLSGKGALAPKPAPAKRETQLFHTDLFDLVKGHLLDEGYADTEEAAIVIMVNMSEEWRDEIVERYKGKHGQSSDEYKDDRSPGGKMVSGDSKQSGAEYTHGRRVKAENPGSQPDEGGKTKPKSQGKMDKGTRADLEYRKANLKKEEVELDENRRAARSAGGYKDDSEGQPDPSKEGFTGIGKMSIKDIMALNKKIEARKAKKEETQVEGDQIDEVLGGQAGDGYIGHPRLGIKNPMAKKQTNTNTSSNTGIAGKLGNRASQMDAAMKAARGQ